MEYYLTPGYRAGRASDLSGSDYVLYRFFEILPGTLAWLTIIIVILFSFIYPMYAAFFIVSFNLYWILKSIYLSIHLRRNWKNMRHNLRTDWREQLKGLDHSRILHLVILPFYNEGSEVVEKSIQSLVDAHVDKSHMAVVLATEGRSKSGLIVAERARQKFGGTFAHFLVTVHPDGIEGEMAGKGSNIAYAAEEARKKILDAHAISYDDVLVSAFDIDTVVYSDYFICLAWNFLSSPDRYRLSYQPVPLYNNNIWQAPAFSRMVAMSGSFWQMIQQERPERLATFSSHSMPFRSLYDVGYWQKNMVSEDSRIFWNSFMRYNGNYSACPITYPVSLDANLAPTFLQTMKNIYKQQRRWAWGVENVPYILFGFVKNKKIALGKRLEIACVELERAWSLSTNPLLLFLLSWLPMFVGGRAFHETLLAYNLPSVTRFISVIGVLGLIFSAYLSLSFLPPAPRRPVRLRRIFIGLQWIFIPLTLVIFGSFPALDAQTRLMFGKYMGFWVTPKHRL